MKNLYVVMGGIGKCLLWTSLIPSLCNKDKVDKKDKEDKVSETKSEVIGKELLAQDLDSHKILN